MICRGRVHHKSTCDNMLRPRKIKELVLPHPQHATLKVWQHQQCASVSNSGSRNYHNTPVSSQSRFYHERNMSSTTEHNKGYALTWGHRPARSNTAPGTQWVLFWSDDLILLVNPACFSSPVCTQTSSLWSEGMAVMLSMHNKKSNFNILITTLKKHNCGTWLRGMAAFYSG